MKHLNTQFKCHFALLCFLTLSLFSLNLQALPSDLNVPITTVTPPNCTSLPIITCPPAVNTCVNGNTDPSVTGMATAVAGDPSCAAPTVGFYDLIISSGPCSGQMVIKRIWYAFYPNNTALYVDCYQEITLADNTAPQINNCPTNITIAANNPDCSATVNWVIPTAVDDCGLASFTATHVPGTNFAYGTVTTVGYTATDNCGNIQTCSFIITVDGGCCTEDPILTCPSNYNGCPGTPTNTNTTGVATAIAGGSFCDAPTVSYADQTVSQGTCGDISIQRTWTATDPNDPSLTVSCIQNITLSDNTAPVISNCPADVTLQSNDGNPVSTTWTLPTATDNCGLLCMGVSTTFTQADVVGTPVPLTTFGTQCAQLWNTVFAPAPVPTNTAGFYVSSIPVTIPTGGTYTFTPEYSTTVGCNLIFYLIPAGTFDPLEPCAGYIAPGGTGIAGTTIYTGSDFVPAGDYELLVCQGDMNSPCDFTINMKSDIATQANTNLYPVGVTTVNYSAIDNCGNESTCSFNVTVENLSCMTPPILNCPADIAACPGGNTDPKHTGFPVALPGGANCGLPVVSFTDVIISQGSCGDIHIQRTWTASDANDPTLVTSCVQEINYTDNTPPIVNCPFDIFLNSTDGNPIIVNWTTPVPSDNCGVQSISSSIASGSLFPLGNTVVTYTATDNCGNVTTCFFTVVISDTSCTVPPVINCPANYSNCPGSSIDPAVTGSATATPGGTNCASPNINYNDATISQGSCGDLTIHRTWTAVDVDNPNLSSQCVQTITLSDTSDPVINCPANITQNSTDGNPMIVNWVTPVPSDNCGIQSINSSAVNGSLFPIGMTTVTYTVSDNCGNISTCTFTIMITDLSCMSPPNISCPANYTSCPASSIDPTVTGSATATPGGTNCASPNINYSDATISQGSCGDLLIHRTWTATSPSNSALSSSCVQVITLTDTTPPAIVCPTNLSFNSPSGGPMVTYWTVPTPSDNCGIASVSSTHNSGDIFPIGITTVSYTVTDNCGNTNSCSFTIEIIALPCSLPPMMTCPADYVACPGSSTDVKFTGFPTALPGGSNCGTPLVSFTDVIISQGTCGDIEIQRTWTAADANDPTLSITCVQNILLIDNEAPIISCPANITIQSTDGNPVVATWTGATATDNCGATVSGNYTSGDSFPVGVTNVDYTAVDACGNTATCGFSVTVENMNISMTCPPDLTVNCSGSTTPVHWDIPTINSPCNDCTSPGAISGFMYLGDFNGHHYYCSLEYETWINAQAICAANGGYLAVVNDAAENTFLANALVTQSAYIGYSDYQNEGNFTWVNGDPSTYTNWFPGQPNNYNGAQHFVEMLNTGEWNDQYAKISLEYIMEIPCNVPVQTAGPANNSHLNIGTHTITYEYADACGTTSCSFNVTVKESLSIACPSDIVIQAPNGATHVDVKWSTPAVQSCCSASGCSTGGPLAGFIFMGSYNGSNYYCSTTNAIWANAQAHCELNGGHLAVVNDAGENAFLTGLLQTQNAYIGLSDYQSEGNFTWVNGDPLTYTNWFPGQPNNSGGAQHYVELMANGYWNDNYAKVALEYIMEIPACTTINQIAGPSPGSGFAAGSTTTITYAAMDACGNVDTCSFDVIVETAMCASAGTTSHYTHIDHFGFGPIQNTSGDNGGYADFSDPCYDMTAGDIHGITLTPGYSANPYHVYWKVFADWNMDGDFFDAGEFIMFGNGVGTLTGKYQIPYNVWNGNVTIRVVMSYGGYVPNACTTYSHGETEDYCINISGGDFRSDMALMTRENTDAIDLGTQLEKIEDKTQIKVYPNPAKSFVNLELISDDLVSANNYNAFILDAQGKTVKTLKLNTENNRIDIADLSPGIYLVRLVDESQNLLQTKKLIVIK